MSETPDPHPKTKEEDLSQTLAADRAAYDFLFGKTEIRAAEEFLASGGKPILHGFDPLDPEIRRTLIERPEKEFIDFQVNPVPSAIARDLEKLPLHWQNRPSAWPLSESICRAFEHQLALPRHLYASLNERNELWICRR